MKSHYFFLAAIISCAVFSAIANCTLGETRAWTDSTGKHKISAELLSVDDGIVVLRKDDGKLIKIPLLRLSKQDREFVEKTNNPALEKPVGSDAPKSFADLA